MTKFELIKKIAQMHDDLKQISDAVVSLPTQECVSPVSDKQAMLLRMKYEHGVTLKQEKQNG